MTTEVRTRRLTFDLADSIPKYFVSDDPVMSHVVAMLSAMFPPGEEYFVRSVRAARDAVQDPELREHVRGFIGQEAMHGREHRALNNHLAALGYPTKGLERIVDNALRFRERIQGRRANLAVTAALEHYTATLAETLLSDDRARALFDCDAVRNLLLWHALEESEHKAVAFDVFRDAGGSERLRCLMMNLTTGLFLLSLVTSTVTSLAMDADVRRDPARLLRSLARLRRSPFLTLGVLRRIRAYNRPGFHPDDIDATALLQRWQAELFGAEGTLTPLIRTA